MNKITVLFDLDGTLVDTAEDIIKAINLLCLEHKHPLADPLLLKNNTTFGLNKLLEIALKINLDHISKEELQKLRSRFKLLYNQTKFTDSKLFPGILDLLENLKQYKFKMGVVTNKHLEFAIPILQQTAIKDYFSCVVSADMLEKPKPAPDGLLLAMQRLGVTSEECLFVGDGENDIIAGRAAQIKTVAALFGYIGEDMVTNNWEADYLVHSPDELWPLIKNLYL